MKQANKARAFAALAHQLQFYGGRPYITHLDTVASLVGDDDIAKTIAYLHDVVEDQPVTLQVIENNFGKFVAECVSLVTDEPGRNRKARKSATNEKLARVDSSHLVALLVKVADRTANVEACVAAGNTELLNMYRKEHEDFKLACYVEGLCDHLWERIDKALA